MSLSANLILIIEKKKKKEEKRIWRVISSGNHNFSAETKDAFSSEHCVLGTKQNRRAC